MVFVFSDFTDNFINFRNHRAVFTFMQPHAVSGYLFCWLHITWWVRNGGLGSHISKISQSVKANDEFVWKCTVIVMLDYVLIIMNKPLNFWAAGVVFGSHDWGGVRLFCLNL